MNLTDRKRLILQAIIDDYILTGVPVGSRTISKRSDMNFSSATIRNEMADLEESGYLEQPHTSAGRRPSEKAYRLYVDTLMSVSNLTGSELNLIGEIFDRQVGAIDTVIESTAKALSALTNLTSVVLAPEIARVDIKRIQIVRVSDSLAIVVFVLSNGMVKDIPTKIPENIDSEYLEMLSNLMTACAQDLTPLEAMSRIRHSVGTEINKHREFFYKLLEVVNQNITSTPSKNVVLGGTGNLLSQPECRDIERAQNILKLLETKDALYELLIGSRDMEFTIKIGSENGIDELRDMSVVTATYSIGDRNMGTLGVIGPTRMDYRHVISVLSQVSLSMNEILSYLIEE